jgi:dihydrolipoamide dehydrogenase
MKVDVCIIGGGPGGYVAAIKAAQRGLTTVLVEKDTLGGVCLNWGCIPTKTMLKSAKVYVQTLHASTYGVVVDKESVKPDLPTMIRKKNGVVRKLTSGVKYLLEKNHVTVIHGTATAVDESTIQVGDEHITASSFLIATGASVFLPPIKGIEEALKSGYAMTAKELLDLQEIPKHLVVVGGGVIGFEFATVFNAIGSKVTIVEMLPDVLTTIDHEVRDAFLQKIKKDGIEVRTNTSVTSLMDGVHLTTQEGDISLDADRVLIATGMRPNIKGLEALGFKTNRFGIETNEYMQTANPNVYAIGDVTGQYMLAHVASKEGLVAIDHITNQAHPMDYTKIPSGVYTFPEIGMIGWTEAQAKEAGIAYNTFSFPLSANGKALGEQEREGFVKLISDAQQKIIGVHILSPIATELITQSSVGMYFNMTAQDLIQAIHPHPTYSEMIHEAAHGLTGFPIHI